MPLTLKTGVALLVAVAAGCGGGERESQRSTQRETTCTERTTTNYEGDITTYCEEDYATDYEEGQGGAGESAAGELHGIELGAGVSLLDQEATERLVTDMYENFGGGLGGEQSKTSWYSYIEAVGVSSWDGKATVRTSLYDDSDAVEPAASICRATIGAGAAGARVTDAGGSTLAECP